MKPTTGFFKSKNVKKTVCTALIIVIVLCGVVIYYANHHSTQAAIIAREEIVSRGDIVEGLTEEGTAAVSTVSTKLDVDVTIDETKVNLDVNIDEVFVRAGENVQQGQPLFSIESTSLNTALSTLNNEYQQGVLKLNQAKLNQQKKGAEALTAKNIDAALQTTIDSTYQSSVKKIENQLAQYQQNVRDNEEDLIYYTKLHDTYDERTANLAMFKHLMEAGKENHEALQKLFDDYQDDNGDVVASYNNAEKTTENLIDSLDSALADLTYLSSHEGDKDYDEAITKAQTTYSSIANQFNDAVDIINQYQSTVDQYYTLEDKVEASQDAYDDAAETYNAYHAEYKEMYGALGKSDLARKVSQLGIDLQKAQVDLEEYELNYPTAIQETENKRLTDLTTSQTANLTYDSTITELELAVLTAQNKVDKLSAAINKINALLEGQTLVAPCSGLVTSVDFADGDEVNLLEAAITIAKPDVLSITLSLDQEDIGDVFLDQRVNVTFDAFNRQTFVGAVTAISISPARVGAPTVSYGVTVSLVGEGLEDIYEGMSCQVVLVTEQVQDVLKVSKRALLTEGEITTVKVRSADGTTSLKEVTIGFTDGNEVEILSGVSEGDVLLIESPLTNTATDNTPSGKPSTTGTPSATGVAGGGRP